MDAVHWPPMTSAVPGVPRVLFEQLRSQALLQPVQKTGMHHTYNNHEPHVKDACW